MRGYLLGIGAAATLLGCQPAQVTLPIGPAFYASAIAHDPVHDRYFVASYASGEIVIIQPDGTRVATVRQSGAPVLQVSYASLQQRLWVLTPHAVETIELAPGAARRTVLFPGPAVSVYADLVSDESEHAFVLDAATRAILEVNAEQRSSRVVARLPDMGDVLATPAAIPHCLSAPDAGALLLLDEATLIAASDERLWRVDLRQGQVAEIALSPRLPHVSQLVRLASSETAYRIAALRGQANDIVTIHLRRDQRRAVVDSGTRIRYDTPFHGTFDGRRLVVLLGRMRHHPSLCGDGRPNLPARLASYSPAEERLTVVRAAGEIVAP